MAQDDRPRRVSDDTARERFGTLLQGSLAPTVIAGALMVVVVAAAVGPREAWSAGLGVVVVVGFFSLSLLVMRQTAHLEPTTMTAAVLATYTAKIIALGLAAIAMRDASWLSGAALALTVIVSTVVWLAFAVRAFAGLRMPVTDVPALGMSARQEGT